MLEKVDLTKKISKEEYKEKMPQLESKLGRLQRECKALGIPVLIVFEGFGAAGKGLQIGHLIQSMDPRGFEVHPVKNETEEERMHPFMWRFWTKTPARGRIAIFDGSWYRKVLIDRFEKRTKAKDLPAAFHSINSFEQQLADDGNLIIKLFLDIDKKEQKKRFDKLAKNKETAWRVSQGDRERNAHYDEYAALMEDMLFNTDTDYAPWTIVESMDRRFATLKIYTTVIKAMADQIEKVQQQNIAKAVEKADKAEAEGVVRKKETNGDEIEEIAREADAQMKDLQVSILSKADLSLSYTREEYKEKLDKLQKKMDKLHGELYRRRIPVVLGFEGWDAGGKGGAIKRLTAKMDARGYVVNPTASPNDIEKAHHYLWRFWRAMPKDGHVAIFDRTWYGRVMVERIEGFCTTEEWKRAYKEINDMEKDLYNAGAIVIKFWMHIDKDEQERRFKERQENPEKQWKITDEDWRNREKWDQYEDAVNEMLMRTSTDYAPWVVVEGNSKYYARVKVLQTVVDAIEKRLKEE
ncbi:phosphate--AMP phosphotransferase [Mediterraneibacter catenae]|uniref:Phosphate--AMP phosphotransferase n=1 Tax=Mediterraneibacter catenae TaxID=2594882 RepID=A0A5M9HTR6_9FIRM|nr:MULTISPECIES: phosphate--AMP phosphotransferase [Mediterraneibacter]KAA8500370.1 phosphate--AMP phosphotransferase [Mediterraneibacter catenae]MDN0062380.1 phosphate--AMP phosphotransferase [Mediterraneibacter glycyrrhizinilyticus]OUO26192.1 phosphate--AMP phosphotransferase [Lachnoclostridium sp. An298]